MLFSEVRVYVRNFKSRGKIVISLGWSDDKMKRVAMFKDCDLQTRFLNVYALVLCLFIK